MPVTSASVRVVGLPSSPARLDKALGRLADKELSRLQAAGESADRGKLLDGLKELVQESFADIGSKSRDEVAKGFEEMMSTYSFVLSIIPTARAFQDKPALKAKMLKAATGGIEAAQRMADRVRADGTVRFSDFVKNHERAMALAPAVEAMLR